MQNAIVVASKGMHVFRFKAVESNVNGVVSDKLGLVFGLGLDSKKWHQCRSGNVLVSFT